MIFSQKHLPFERTLLLSSSTQCLPLLNDRWLTRPK